jgi:hypothetical protein
MIVKRKRTIFKDTPQHNERPTISFDNQNDSFDTYLSDSFDGRDLSLSEVDTSTDSSTRSRSNVWLYAHRHPTANGWAICDLCPSLPTPKRISTKGGATTTLRKHLIKVHNKIELLLARQDCNHSEKVSPIHRDRLHKLLINAIVVDGRCFGDFRKAGFSQFLECAVPGKSRSQCVTGVNSQICFQDT